MAFAEQPVRLPCAPAVADGSVWYNESGKRPDADPGDPARRRHDAMGLLIRQTNESTVKSFVDDYFRTTRYFADSIDPIHASNHQFCSIKHDAPVESMQVYFDETKMSRIGTYMAHHVLMMTEGSPHVQS